MDPSRLRVAETTHRAHAENRPLSSAASTHACAQFQVRGGNQPRWYSGLSESRFACRGARRQRAHRTVVHCATVWQAGLRVAGWHTGIVHDRELCCRVGKRCTPHLPRRYRMTTRADRRTVGCHRAVRAARTSRGMRRSRIRLGEFCDYLVLDCDGGVSRGGECRVVSDDHGWFAMATCGVRQFRSHRRSRHAQRASLPQHWILNVFDRRVTDRECARHCVTDTTVAEG